MITRSVSLRDGTLRGTLHQPKTNTFLVIMCHGLNGSSEHPAIAGVAKGLQAKGYATFTFTFSDPIGMDAAQQVGDIASIITHFKDSYSKIILLAGSFGALSASIAARHYAVDALITVNGFFGMSRLGLAFMPRLIAFKILTATSHLYKSMWTFYRREFKPEDLTIPTLILHAKKDELVSIAQSRHFYNRLVSTKQFVELDHADHNLTTIQSIDMVVDRVDKWLRNKFNLAPAPEQKTNAL